MPAPVGLYPYPPGYLPYAPPSQMPMPVYASPHHGYSYPSNPPSNHLPPLTVQPANTTRSAPTHAPDGAPRVNDEFHDDNVPSWLYIADVPGGRSKGESKPNALDFVPHQWNEWQGTGPTAIPPLKNWEGPWYKSDYGRKRFAQTRNQRERIAREYYEEYKGDDAKFRKAYTMHGEYQKLLNAIKKAKKERGGLKPRRAKTKPGDWAAGRAVHRDEA